MISTILDNSPSKAVSEVAAYAVASAYTSNYIDTSVGVGKGSHFYHKPMGKAIWQFMLYRGETPLHPLYVDAQSGAVVPLTDDEMRKVHERAAIAVAEAQEELPIDDQGYVLSEYARRTTNGYLSREVSLFCGATDGVLIPLEWAIWQFAIRFKLPEHGELGILGTIDVDAGSGEVIPLSPLQIEQMKARANAIVELQTQPAVHFSFNSGQS